MQPKRPSILYTWLSISCFLLSALLYLSVAHHRCLATIQYCYPYSYYFFPSSSASAFSFTGPPSQYSSSESSWQRLSMLQRRYQSRQRVIQLQTPSYHLLFQTSAGTGQFLWKQMWDRCWVAIYLLWDGGGKDQHFFKKEKAEEEVWCRTDRVSSNSGGWGGEERLQWICLSELCIFGPK